MDLAMRRPLEPEDGISGETDHRPQGENGRGMGNMAQSTNWLSDKVDPKEDLAESKLRGIFLASLVLCALIGGHLFFLTNYSTDSQTVVRVALLPIMLWAFAVTGYSFHSPWCVAGKRKAKLQEIVRRDSQTGAYTDTYLFERL